jgi:hypothetical protein
VLSPTILDTWEAEIGRIEVQDQPGQKALPTTSQPIKASCAGAFACHPSYTGKINRGQGSGPSQA